MSIKIEKKNVRKYFCQKICQQTFNNLLAKQAIKTQTIPLSTSTQTTSQTSRKNSSLQQPLPNKMWKSPAAYSNFSYEDIDD
jgi:hypothetical protein